MKWAGVALLLACAPRDVAPELHTRIAAMQSDVLSGLPSGFEWQRLEEGTYVSYVGLPKRGDTRWMVLIIKPTPGVPGEPARNDAEHRTLSDGTVLHVSVWSQPNEGPAPRVPSPFPEVDGWAKH